MFYGRDGFFLIAAHRAQLNWLNHWSHQLEESNIFAPPASVANLTVKLVRIAICVVGNA